MYCSFSDIRGARLVNAQTDNELGTLKDLYFDERNWQVAYFVIETGSWFSSHRILITPGHIERVDIRTRLFYTAVDEHTIESAPSADSVVTESQAGKARNASDSWLLPADRTLMHLAHPGTLLPSTLIEAGISVEPAVDVAARDAAADDQSPERTEQHSYLRSAAELLGYAIAGTDDQFGALHDLLLDPQEWSINWLSVDTGRWLPGRLVVLSPDWSSHLSWQERQIGVRLTRKQVKSAPALHTIDSLERSYEHALYEHYYVPMI